MSQLPQLPSNRFVLGPFLGEGGTSRVYRVWHVEQGQWCAVKVLHADAKPALRRRFLAEGEFMCRLSHRNVLRGWELSQDEPPYLVMDIAEGGSLKDWVTRHGAMSPRLAVDVAIQICKGVATAHRVGVVHRDIKPHNVLVARRGICKVTDFGIAKFATAGDASHTQPGGDPLGTLGYMAPEQHAHAESSDVRADVYGIGATLFHLLAGRSPPANLFAAGEYRETFEGLPEPLVPILRKACAYRPEDRFPTAQELARALHDLWRQLPDPPPDSPTLMTGMPPELPPPEGMSWMTPMSDHGRRSWPLRDLPSLDDASDAVSTPMPAPEIPLHDSSVIRRALLQLPPPPPPPPPPPRTWIWPAAAFLVAASLSLGVGGLWWVGSAEDEAHQARSEFLALARRDLSVVEELGSLGADRATLLGRYEALRDAPDPEAAAAADAWLASLREANASAASHPDGRTRAVAARRVEDLDRSREEWRRVDSVWSRRAHSLPGKVLSLTGLVGPAPPPDTGGGGR